MDDFESSTASTNIHGRVRLGVTPGRRGRPAILKAVWKATDGNLSVHLRKLEDAGYVVIAKSFVLVQVADRRVRLTAAGLPKPSSPDPPAMERLVAEARAG